MKRSTLVPIAIGFAWGLAIDLSMRETARKRAREEELYALERELLEAAVLAHRARTASLTGSVEEA